MNDPILTREELGAAEMTVMSVGCTDKMARCLLDHGKAALAWATEEKRCADSAFKEAERYLQLHKIDAEWAEALRRERDEAGKRADANGIKADLALADAAMNHGRAEKAERERDEARQALRLHHGTPTFEPGDVYPICVAAAAPEQEATPPDPGGPPPVGSGPLTIPTKGGSMEIPSKPTTPTTSSIHDLLAQAAELAVLEEWSDVAFQTEATTAYEDVDLRGEA